MSVSEALSTISSRRFTQINADFRSEFICVIWGYFLLSCLVGGPPGMRILIEPTCIKVAQ